MVERGIILKRWTRGNGRREGRNWVGIFVGAGERERGEEKERREAYQQRGERMRKDGPKSFKLRAHLVWLMGIREKCGQ